MSKPRKQVILGAYLGGVEGSDGFIIGSRPAPTGLDEFVDRVVALLQERGSLRAGYTGTTLRDSLGIPATGPAVSATVA